MLKRAKKQGLQISDDCRIIGKPHFGSEPYLISIGKNVTISSKVTFHTHDGGTWVFRNDPTYNKLIKFGRITVEDNCFIGHGTIILPGVTIHSGSVIGTGSVVTKDVPPGEVWAGVPAAFISTTEEYAKKSLENSPTYNRELFEKDKKAALLDIFPYPW